MELIMNFSVKYKSNNTLCNNSDVYEFFPSEWTKYLTIGMLSLLPLATLIGNFIVILTVLKRRKQHQNMNTFVISLAIADLAVGIFVMPVAIYRLPGPNRHDELTFLDADVYCPLIWSFDVMFTTTSILHLMCMTIDRYLAVSLPLRYKKFMNVRCLIVLLVLCWTIPAVFSFGLIFFKVHQIGMLTEDFKLSKCKTYGSCEFRVNAIYAITGSMISFYLPSIFMLFCNIKLFWSVKNRGAKLKELTSQYIRNFSARTTIADRGEGSPNYRHFADMFLHMLASVLRCQCCRAFSYI